MFYRVILDIILIYIGPIIYIQISSNSSVDGTIPTDQNSLLLLGVGAICTIFGFIRLFQNTKNEKTLFNYIRNHIIKLIHRIMHKR